MTITLPCVLCQAPVPLPGPADWAICATCQRPRADADRVMRLVSEWGYTVAQVQQMVDRAAHSRDAVTAAEHRANAQSATAVAKQQLDAIRAELTPGATA